MKKLFPLCLVLFLLACNGSPYPCSDQVVQEATNRAIEWQMQAYPRMNDMRIYKADGDLSWQNAIFLFSTMEWAAYTGNTDMNAWGCHIADTNAFRLSNAQRIYHADDLVIGSFYARCFDHTGDTAALRSAYGRLRYIIESPSSSGLDLDYAHPETLERWSWCDALFMAPPVFAEYARIFNDPQLLGFMDHEFWATVDYLYSREDSLFFRDSGYFTKQEANGKPIFWGRGNAWVIAGLARLIPLLPESMRLPYERLFKQMAERLIELQLPDGSWHASMLDPDSYPAPETSSTGLIGYALWWGINNGYLDADLFLPHAEAAWQVMTRAQHDDGMLGYVQPIGADPREVTADMTEVYGAAAMALMAIQIMEHNRLLRGEGRLEEADRLMTAEPLSVMLKKEAPASGDKHDYMSIARYSWPNPDTADGLPYIHRDGESNPELADFDRLPLGTTAERITTLANAFARTGNERYATKATQLIRTWFIDDSTRMHPNLRYAQVVKGVDGGNGRSMGIIDAYSFVEMLEALSASKLLEKSNYRNIDSSNNRSLKSSEIVALRRWFADLYIWMTTDSQALAASHLKNNLSIAYDAECIAFARFAGLQEEAWNLLRTFDERRIRTQIAPDGSQPEELTRTLAYHYSAYNISHMIDVMRMAQAENIGLHTPDIKRAVDYLLRYTGGEPWPYQQLSGMEEAQRDFSRLAIRFMDDLAVNRRKALSQWEFRRGDSDTWQTVTLPHSCNAVDGQSEHYYRGDAFYRTTIEASEEMDKGYRLLFMQAAQRTTVFLNGEQVADHFGGYTPFTVDLSRHIRLGNNELLVRTNNEMDLTMAPVSSDFNKNNGLHGMVYLLTQPGIRIDSRLAGYRGMLVSTPEVTDQQALVRVRTYITNPALLPMDLRVRAFLREADGRIVAQSTQALAMDSCSTREVCLDIRANHPHLWNGLADPYRYTVDLLVEAGDIVFEHCSARIGIRSVEARKDGFCLNGKSYPLRGFSYHQDKYLRASALTKADLDADFRLIRELGCNMLRLAHYPHSEYAFDLCDSLGILVQTEIPWVNECGRDTTAYSQSLYAEHLLQAWEEMIRGHYNHPSIAFWGMWNELGGSHAGRPQGEIDTTFLVLMTDTLYRLGKQLDPQRLIGFADMGYGMSIRQLQLGRNYDYFGANRYLGWYVEQQRPENAAGLGGFMDHIHNNWGPCAITEYGAGGSPYCHSDNPTVTTVPATGGARHDEEWFNTLHENSVRVIKERPCLLFTSAWVLCDFAVADRREGYITSTDGITEDVDSMKLFINDKGIISRDRLQKKDAFYLYKAWWNPAPTVYISQRRFSTRTSLEIGLRVYSNARSLTLYRNGQPLQTLSDSGEPTGLIWQFDPVEFHSDADEFRVEGSYPNGLTANDIVTFRFRH